MDDDERAAIVQKLEKLLDDLKKGRAVVIDFSLEHKSGPSIVEHRIDISWYYKFLKTGDA